VSGNGRIVKIADGLKGTEYTLEFVVVVANVANISIITIITVRSIMTA
jgi:hypothetical protein